MTRRAKIEDGEIVRIRPSKGAPKPIRSLRWQMAQRKQKPKSDRPVDLGGISILPGQEITLNGKRIRATDDGGVQVHTLFGWKSRPLR